MHKALSDYDEALRLNPGDSNVLVSRAGVLYRKKEYDRALADCNEGLRLNPKSADAYLTRASVWWMRGQLDNAGSDIDEALRINPASSHARTMKSTLQSQLSQRYKPASLEQKSPIQLRFEALEKI